MIYLHSRESDLVEGILHSQDLQEEIRSDYPYHLIDGPINYKGRKSFIQMYLYSDSNDMDYFLYKQRIYRMPNNQKNKLVYDFNHSCKLSTFLNKGDILT